ncbi:DNA-binding protein [Paraburkholderia sp. XV]|uniref:DNA-binding protein n=1 Tax=Paraburkholderia sp. XV TaxID=2831520 RepID=UPI001CD6CD02|nr:DNA-binding protein [Paraburkholderia sp. XV]
MAREPAITQDQVSKAAEAISETGARPTARAVRERLGEGSMATVLKYLQAWKDAQIRPAEPPVTLPQPLQRGLIEFVAAEVERSKAELRAELEAANQSNADLILESERQGLMIENLNASLERAYAEKAELSGRLDQVVNERDAASHEAATERQAAEAARTELAKAELRLEAMPRLEKELGDLRDEIDIQRARRTEAEQAAAVADARFQGAVEARKTAEAALDEAKKGINSKDEELASLRAELKEARASNSDLREKLATLSANTPRPARRARRAIAPLPKKPRE